MTRLEKIEADVKALSPAEARKFAAWFADWQADLWDDQIERDVQSGKLDKLIAEAREDIKAGRVSPL